MDPAPDPLDDAPRTGPGGGSGDPPDAAPAAAERRGRPRPSSRRATDALYGFLRLIATRVRSFYGAVVTYLSFSFFVGLGAVWVFIEVADEVLEGATQRFDERVLTWVAEHRSGVLDHVALELTALGNFATLTVLILVASLFLWLTHHRLSVALLMSAVAGGALLNNLLKGIFDRPRPTVVEAGTEVMTTSFPSGHAMSAFIAYATVAYLCGRLGPTPRLRWTAWGLASLLILAVGASRIYLGVHYPSDVVAGFLGGLAWLAFVISGLTAIRYFSRRDPTAAKEERDLDVDQPAD